MRLPRDLSGRDLAMTFYEPPQSPGSVCRDRQLVQMTTAPIEPVSASIGIQ
jgi:hypothetical protein